MHQSYLLSKKLLSDHDAFKNYQPKIIERAVAIQINENINKNNSLKLFSVVNKLTKPSSKKILPDIDPEKVGFLL